MLSLLRKSQPEHQNKHQQFKLLIFGYIREFNELCLKCNHALHIPIDIKYLILEHYPKVSRLKFSTIYLSKSGWELTESSQTAWHCEKGDCHRWIALETEPMKTGIHVWRTHITNPNGYWLLFGVCVPNELYKNDVYANDKRMFGLSCNNDYYFNPSYKDIKCSTTSKTGCLRYQGEYEVDVLFDCDSGYFEVRRLDDDHPKFWIKNIPKQTNGYSIYYNSTQAITLRVCTVPTHYFGKTEYAIDWEMPKK